MWCERVTNRPTALCRTGALPRGPAASPINFAFLALVAHRWRVVAADDSRAAERDLHVGECRHFLARAQRLVSNLSFLAPSSKSGVVPLEFNAGSRLLGCGSPPAVMSLRR